MYVATSTEGIDKRNARDVALVGPVVQKMIQTFFNVNRSINPNEALLDITPFKELDTLGGVIEAHRAQHSHSHEERAPIRPRRVHE